MSDKAIIIYTTFACAFMALWVVAMFFAWFVEPLTSSRKKNNAYDETHLLIGKNNVP